MSLVHALFVALLIFSSEALGHAASGGVQWSPDGVRLFVNKDVGAERWSITLNLTDLTATGNIFFTDGRAPAFVWCQRTGHNHEPNLAKLTLKYSCYGSSGAIGGFSFDDWTLISDNVQLDAVFFAPDPETCDLSGVTNGPNAQSATSYWDCGGTGAAFQFQAFDDGTGFSSTIGPFEFDLVHKGCGFGRRADGVYFNAIYAPSRDLLTLYETDAQVEQAALSECHRKPL